MPDVNRGDRPLSPFMIGQYYRPQMTSMSSILIRITGIALLLASVLIVWWFLAAASSPEYFAVADGVLTSWFGKLVFLVSIWGLWFHTLGGLRHLYWDNGGNMDVPFAEKLGWGMFIGSVVLTVLTVIMV